MVDEQTLTGRVPAFVSEERGVALSRVRPDSELYGDLKLYGDDVEEFFYLFSGRFGVPLEGLDISGCFPGEGGLHALVGKWVFRPERALRVHHLIEAATTGTWPPPSVCLPR